MTKYHTFQGEKVEVPSCLTSEKLACFQSNQQVYWCSASKSWVCSNCGAMDVGFRQRFRIEQERLKTMDNQKRGELQ